MKEIFDILATDIFRGIMNNNHLKVAQLNAAVALLVKSGISFTLTFTPGTRRIAPQAQLTIFIKPSTSVNITIAFDTGELIL